MFFKFRFEFQCFLYLLILSFAKIIEIAEIIEIK